MSANYVSRGNRFVGGRRTASETTQSAGWTTARRTRPGPAPPCSTALLIEPRRFRRALDRRTPGSPPTAPRRRGRAARARRRGRGHPGRARPRGPPRAPRLGRAPRPAGRSRPGGHPRRAGHGPGARGRGRGDGQGGRAAADVTVTLAHPAAIDPFAGLVPARTVEVWRASRQDGRWRVAAEPVSLRAQLPGDDRAPEAVSAWVERLLDCDRPGAADLQAGAELYGPADLAELPCTERGRWTVAAPEGFDAAVEPEAYVAAFGPEVGAWARLVPVQGPRTRFSVVVGPLGDAWRVLGTDPVTPR